MAKASVQVVKQPVTLELTHDEAAFLFNLLGRASGTNPNMVSIYNALNDVRCRADFEHVFISVNINRNNCLHID